MKQVQYKLTPYQHHFIMSDERVVSIIGAKGSSKTWSGARFVARMVAHHASDGRHAQGLVMLNSRQQVLDIFEQDIRPLFDELGWEYTINAQSLNIKVFNTIIHLRSADPDAVKKIESVAYHWGWADEASYYPPETLKTFVSRIRKGDALIRITSMPDEPDAFMYGFLENYDGKMYEIGLRDNPDREFRERYEKFLRATYSGAQLERFLSGKRVSLEGEGIFAVEGHMRVDCPGIDFNRDLVLSWDFNVEYRAVSAWQEMGVNEEGQTEIRCVDSWQMKNATVYEDAIWLADWLSERHKATVWLHGDASGNSRTAQTTDSMWKTIRSVFKEKNVNFRYVVPASNPRVKDTIQCVNWALRAGLVTFNKAERNTYMSLQACRADKYGEIDKSIDYNSKGGARTHDADTARYAIWHYYKHQYPGATGKVRLI